MMLTVQDTQIYLVDKGSGTPTLFLHGNPDSSDLWEGVIQRLQSDYRCLAPDLPGFGRSYAPESFDCSLEGMARFIDGLVTAIGIQEPLNLVVHDFGGPYGLSWAVRHPAKVRSIAMISTIFYSDFAWHLWANVWRTPLLGELSMALVNPLWFRFEVGIFGSRKMPDEYLHKAYTLLSAPTRRMILKLYRATDPPHFRGWEDELHQLTARVPALVLWGKHDPYLPYGWAAKLGVQDTVILPDCGHWLPAEDPQAVAEHLRQLLARA